MLDAGAYSFNVIFRAPCPTCNELRPVKGPGKCPICSASLDVNAVAAIRTSIRERRQMFKVRLLRLVQRMHELTDGPLAFKSHGAPRSPEDHFTEVIVPTEQALLTLDEDITRIANSQDWSSNQPECITAFTKLIQLLEDALATVPILQATTPPLEWRAVHRELTRAFASSVRGHIFKALTISASDDDEATKTQADSALAFADAKEHLERAKGLIDLASRLPANGPFQADGSLDVAALTWSSIGSRSTPIAQGADIARKAFAQVIGVSTLPDEQAVMLLPTLALGASVIDHTMVVELATSLSDILNAPGGSSWVLDAPFLVGRVSRGLDLILECSERLGREWRYGLPRHHIIRTSTEVYREMVEGALIDFGAPIIIAGRVSDGDNNASYEEDVVDGIKAGEAVEALERLAPLSRGAIEMTFRNASAHAGISVTETGVVAVSYRTENGRVIPRSRKEIPLTDAAFFEELVELQELLFALQLAVLPWLWSHPDPQIVKAMAGQKPTIRLCNQTLSLLGGLAGLNNIKLDAATGNVTITAEQLIQTIHNPNEINTLSLIPATFALSPEIKRVTLDIRDRRPATFERTEFMDTQEDVPHQSVLLGLFMAKWLLVSRGRWLEQEEAANITVPLTQLLFDLSRLISHQPYQAENIRLAVKSWKMVKTGLGEILPVEQRGSLTQKAVEQLDAFCKSITGLAESKDLGRSVEANLYAAQAVAALHSIYDIQQHALMLRDAS
jgi:hypothetical protein